MAAQPPLNGERDTAPLAPDRTPMAAPSRTAREFSPRRPSTAFMPRREGGVILTGSHPELGTARVALDAQGNVVVARYTPRDPPLTPGTAAEAAAKSPAQPPLVLAAARLAICQTCEHHQHHTRTTVKCALAPNAGSSGCRCTSLLTGTCPEGRWTNRRTPSVTPSS